MKIKLSAKDIISLSDRNIRYDFDKDYSEDEAFELSDAIRDAQVFFAQDSSRPSIEAAEKYARIADKIDKQIDAR